MPTADVITNTENSTDSIMQTMPQRRCPGRGDLFSESGTPVFGRGRSVCLRG